MWKWVDGLGGLLLVAVGRLGGLLLVKVVLLGVVLVSWLLLAVCIILSILLVCINMLLGRGIIRGLFGLMAWPVGNVARLTILVSGRLGLVFLTITCMSLVLRVQRWLLLGLAMWTIITVCLGMLVIVVLMVFMG